MIQRKRFLFRLLAAAMVLLCVAAPLEQVRAVGAAAYIPGDIDGDGAVTYNDAIYLLLHTMFSAERYPLKGSPADVDGNGTVDQEDAVYLLLHTLFGKEYYPLKETISLYDLMTGDATIYNAKGISTGKTPLETETADFGTIAYGTVLTQDSLDAIGIANDKMSAQELRELCLRYFKLHLSFLWTPSENVECYPTGSPSLYGKYMQQFAGQESADFDTNTGKALQKGTIY